MSIEQPCILPLYGFFDRLRQNGFHLGVREYEDFIFALRRKYGFSPQKYWRFLQLLQQEPESMRATLFPRFEFLLLTRLVWLKPGQSIQLFEDIYQECFMLDLNFIDDPAKSDIINVSLSQNVTSNDTNPQPDIEEPGTGISSGETEFELMEDNNGLLNVRIATGNASDQNAIGIADKNLFPEKVRFLFRKDFYPFDHRKAEQSLKAAKAYRYIRDTRVVDIETTISQTIDQGYFNGALYKKTKKHTNEILLLLDQQGSMIAFEPLGEQIRNQIETLFGSCLAGVPKTFRTFYFYNCPYECVYKDAALVKAESLDGLLKKLKGKSVAVIILSDAGAARGNIHKERIKATEALLKKIYTSCTSKVAWLNPYPKKRWKNSSAQAIARSVAMFEANETGIQNAVAVIKGSSSSKGISI